MQENFEINAEVRTDQGKGASRRLRRTNKLPAIIYGGGEEPQQLALGQNELARHLENEAFYSHILTVNIDGKGQKAILRDMQRHPSKPFVLHVDFLRVSGSDVIQMNVPLHFINEDIAHGVKQEGGQISHIYSEVQISCKADDLPEYIEVDVKDLKLEESIHMSDLQLPKGVELVELSHGAEHDQPIVSIHKARVITAEEEAAEEEAPSASEVPVAGVEKGEGEES
jgi:large subunit ribosomal protein L25